MWTNQICFWKIMEMCYLFDNYFQEYFLFFKIKSLENMFDNQKLFFVFYS